MEAKMPTEARGIRFPRTGIIGGWKPADRGAGN